MSFVYVGSHHYDYACQDGAKVYVAFVSINEDSVKNWCDSFEPIKEYGDNVEWRSYSKMELDVDHAKADDLGGWSTHVDVPVTYTREFD